MYARKQQPARHIRRLQVEKGADLVQRRRVVAVFRVEVGREKEAGSMGRGDTEDGIQALEGLIALVFLQGQASAEVVDPRMLRRRPHQAVQLLLQGVPALKLRQDGGEVQLVGETIRVEVDAVFEGVPGALEIALHQRHRAQQAPGLGHCRGVDHQGLEGRRRAVEVLPGPGLELGVGEAHVDVVRRRGAGLGKRFDRQIDLAQAAQTAGKDSEVFGA